MKTLALLAAVFYLALAAATEALLWRGGEPLRLLAQSGPPAYLETIASSRLEAEPLMAAAE
ncbi:MAG: hypothetical protein HYZ28_20510 [Myxococcales bacterium]|nr:hypothetical protein [Myxococcales bacterium]